MQEHCQLYEETRETRMQRLHNKQGRKKNESHALYRQTDRQLDKRIARIRFGWRHDAAAGVPRRRGRVPTVAGGDDK